MVAKMRIKRVNVRSMRENKYQLKRISRLLCICQAPAPTPQYSNTECLNASMLS